MTHFTTENWLHITTAGNVHRKKIHYSSSAPLHRPLPGICTRRLTSPLKIDSASTLLEMCTVIKCTTRQLLHAFVHYPKSTLIDQLYYWKLIPRHHYWQCTPQSHSLLHIPLPLHLPLPGICTRRPTSPLKIDSASPLLAICTAIKLTTPKLSHYILHYSDCTQIVNVIPCNIWLFRRVPMYDWVYHAEQPTHLESYSPLHNCSTWPRPTLTFLIL